MSQSKKNKPKAQIEEVIIDELEDDTVPTGEAADPEVPEVEAESVQPEPAAEADGDDEVSSAEPAPAPRLIQDSDPVDIGDLFVCKRNGKTYEVFRTRRVLGRLYVRLRVTEADASGHYRGIREYAVRTLNAMFVPAGDAPAE